MKLAASFFVWKVHVWNLLSEPPHRQDEPGPMLTLAEQDEMERFWASGGSPEDFVKLLESRDSLSRDTVENMK